MGVFSGIPQQNPLGDMEHPLVLDLTSVKTPDRCTSRTIGIIPGRSADAQLEGSGKVILVFKAKLFAYLLYFQ